MNNDTHFSLVMIELEKISTKIDKLAEEIAEFREIMFPKPVELLYLDDPNFYEKYREVINSAGANAREGIITNFYTNTLLDCDSITPNCMTGDGPCECRENSK